MIFKEIIQSVSAKERKLLVWLCIIMVVLTAVPYLFGYLRTPTSTTYTGIHALTAGDSNVYYSYLEQVKQGHYLFQDLYTSEVQPYPYFQPFWFGVGIFAKILNLPNWTAVQLSRLLLVPVFIFIAYLFIAYLFSDKIKRKLAIFLLLFSSGLGGLLSPVLEPGKYIAGGYYHWPMDLWVPESISFLSLYHLPHILASSILFLLVFLLILLAWENNRYCYSVWAGIISFFWFWFHPFHIITVFSVMGGYILISSVRQKGILLTKIKHLLVVFLMALPAVIFYLVFLKIDPLMAGRSLQNILITPIPWMLLISYGFLGILAILGFFKSFRINDEKISFIAIWFMVQLFLLYIPLAFQRRLAQNFHFPVTILAIVGICSIYRFLSRKFSDKSANLLLNNKILMGLLFIIFLAFSNIYVLANDVLLYQNNSYPYFYLTDEYSQVMVWLENNISLNDVVLSEEINGNFIPGMSGRKVYLGHGVETLDYENKLEKVEWFFEKDEESAEKKEFLEENNITYLFWSDAEKGLGSFDPKNKEYLKEVFSNQTVTIYQFID